MLDLLQWLVVVELIGLAALPLAARVFGQLPDRGYAFARPLGALVVAVALWIGCIFGLMSNSGAMVLVLVAALAVAGWIALPSAADEVRAVWRNRRAHVLMVEFVFVAAFLAWAFVRAHIPNIEATEKPMELGFLNGIIRSQRFPPADPWLSGNSISYYYLGYVVVAAITEASGVIPAVAFNLAIATLFAMTVSGAFTLGHALVGGSQAQAVGNIAGSPSNGSSMARVWTAGGEAPGWIAGGVAALFVALLSNLEGFLEILHAHGIGSADFWRSLAIWHLGQPYLSQQWYPTEAQDNWWWFRASRVILDYPSGTPPPDGYNTITEFPFFSFLLGDLHPHLLALPFAFVCLAYALSFMRNPREFRFDRPREIAFEIGFIAFLFGSMFLLNAWDMLTYLFVLVGAFAARRYATRPVFDGRWLRDVVTFGVVGVIASVLVYWPFYLTFRSQATGLLGAVQLHSHLSYFLLFWGPFLFLAASLVLADLLAGSWRQPGEHASSPGPGWVQGPLPWIVAAVVSVIAVAFDAPALAVVVPIGVAALVLTLRYLGLRRAAEVDEEQVIASGEPALASSTVRATGGRRAGIAGGAPTTIWPVNHVFVMWLLFVAMLLILGTELVYIEDSFSSRMNTVFKLYFQAWELLAVVGGYAVYYVGRGAFRRSVSAADGADGSARQLLGRLRLPRPVVAVWLALAVALIGAASVYGPAALASRTDGFTTEPDLNGLTYYERMASDDAAGIAWLQQNVSGSATIVEATGGSYSAFGEVAWMTGLPTILGWDFHEVQWHGASIVPLEDERKHDIDTIYRSTDVKTVQDLLNKYDVSYVYVGPMEQQAYGQSPSGLSKFSQFMDAVYHNSSVTIYRVRGLS
jgi:YYY domain-containing protein